MTDDGYLCPHLGSFPPQPHPSSSAVLHHHLLHMGVELDDAPTVSRYSSHQRLHYRIAASDGLASAALAWWRSRIVYATAAAIVRSAVRG